MAGNNDCVMADLNGKRAAVELANVRPENFTALCYSIDNNLQGTSAQYQATFMRAMNNQLEEHNLLPRVELNMVQQSDNDVLQKLQDRKKHIDTKDLVQAEDQFKDQGRNVESNLVHGLITHQQEIQSTHAERNFWGKNHGGINMDRLNRWSNENRPDMYGALNDVQEAQRDIASRKNESPIPRPEASQRPEANSRPESSSKPEAPEPSPYDRKQDSRIQALEKDEHERNLRAKLKAGVEKDAHVTVHKGDTLEDMATLALHKAGVTHMSKGMIAREAEKIRIINGLEPGEHLTAGKPLMLRTEAEVQRETERRFAAIEKSHSAHAMLSGFSVTESHSNSSSNRRQTSSESYATSYYSIDGSSDDEEIRARRPVRHSSGY